MVSTDVRIGCSVIINVGATVSHDNCLKDYVTLAPGSHLAGSVTAEEGADIGIGAMVIPSRTIGSWSIVGAGAVIIDDVPAMTTVVGSPRPGCRHPRTRRCRCLARRQHRSTGPSEP